MIRFSHKSWMAVSGGGQPGQRGQEDDHDLGHVGGEQEEDELADIVVDDAALLHGRDDAGIVVVRQHHVGAFFGDIGAGDAHGHADVGALDGRGVVHAVAGHGDHLSIGAQRFDDAHLVFRGDTGEHVACLHLALQLGVIQVVHFGPVSTWCPGRSRPMDSAMARAVLG